MAGAPPLSARPADDARLAAEVAALAGDLLLAVRRSLAGAGSKRLGAEGDRRSHELICELLTAARPDDAVLSEEGADDLSRLQRPRVWIVDPLDGTREFGDPPRDDWAVHVALWAGGELAAGAVALPAQGLTLATDPSPTVPPPADGARPRIVVSRSRPPAFVAPLAEALGAEVVPLGSAGAKAMAVVRGHADAYVHAGGQYEWDSAAPAAVAVAAGLHVCRIDGSAPVYNRADPSLPDLVVCRPELAGPILEVLKFTER
ncbi:MAG: 3'(2'),5'-bisphosphate nucleotidase CysQ [Actinomycetota bacterium]|nr:3'(2'),5'-bisphosphate nucleotidase CysQ [Actinomycetota bacterium]